VNIQLSKLMLIYTALLIPQVAWSKIENAVSLSGEVKQSDNGFKNEENKVRERQDQVSVNWSLSYQGSLVDLSTDYDWKYYNFEQDSQAEKNFLTGRTDLFAYTDTKNAGVSLGHEQVIVLQDANLVELNTNLEERSKIYITPFVKKQLTNHDDLILTVDYQDTHYDVRDYKDFNSSSVSVEYQHLFNLISGAVINVGYTKNSYQIDDYYDYEIKRASVVFFRNLRMFQYRLTAGANNVDMFSGTESRPLYGLSLTYRKADLMLSLAANKFITDANDTNRLYDENLDEEWQLDNLGSKSVDRNSFQLNLSYFFFGERSSVNLSWLNERDNYLDIDNDVESNVGAVTLTHAVRQNQKLSLRLSKTKRSSSVDFSQRAYAYSRAELLYRYEMTQKLSASFIASIQERESDDIRLYKENAVGVRISYSFR
jgi:hypothetical protein